MGWGASAAPKAPRPEEVMASAQKAVAEHFKPMTFEVEEVPEPKDPNLVAMTKYMEAEAKRGWLLERRYRNLFEFIQGRGLFNELVEYTRKMR